MAKKNQVFHCSECGNEFSKWFGRCPACNEWNTIVEMAVAVKKSADGAAGTVKLSEIGFQENQRMSSGIGEFDVVCGGGMVSGSVILIGGEPGIGKSTLALQLASYMDTLYVTGEESPLQIRQRAHRLGINSDPVKLITSTAVEDILIAVEKEKPRCVIVDSIQTLYSTQIPGITGSVSQVRESTAKLVALAKKTGIPVILIGHITKEGNIAGPKLLEHIVDTVLYFEGDFSREFRMLRAFKNRFGSVNEIGLFQMTDKGLVEVKDKNRAFLNPYASSAPGNAVCAALEGSRTILFEVQSLVSFSGLTIPRRMADGFDLNRLILLTAVLEKHAGLKLSSFDVFINIAGGFQINETAADLSVAMAIASSLKDVPIPEGIGFLGEISLSGTLRPVPQCARRLKEFMLSGFHTVLLPDQDAAEAGTGGFTGTIKGVRNIQQALECVF
ncbi:MAG TPA: DNA repair protein RadA [Spirochaetota bacterium]|nr:DNA repair protein RadA [Spirochaetota bacterium]HPI89635.1 DNA repair protein RadA [Spirochaetota bacterium]